ncbi:VWA domain-containing protein [Pseudoalteromonas sp. SR44-5]|uniref:TerY-C metal binding domain-containing protein n=1 Tax=unclassified Pseudoalteromonas TaxID=194690 RepID=UPI0015FF7FA8|nr:MULTISPECIES: TerY-C metal binding domain-containing protein [unclassified Pseudoalteromonas]MBB1367650.1 VWA domain-containing protein [Pseudoalteromonas sp. SR44-5]MBB1418556.1 VWA domain-containing protein [Pseudoalteromonas sp. SG44-1]MBB1435470.1 VWA domain-containing protein [Pseudoalteromonas sp. SG43-6]
MRRLPIFFVIDISESMTGEPIELMEKGIESIVSSLRQDPNSLETVFISIIAFAGKSKVIAPLVDLISFYPPKIPVGGGTSLGSALNVLMDEIDTNVKKTTYETRGDWEPIVFLITDGKPTDNPSKAITRWQDKYAKNASLIAITLGLNADIDILNQVANSVLALENTGKNQFFKFIEWVSASVKAQSQMIELNNKNSPVSLDKVDNAGLKVIRDTSEQNISDTSCVTLTGRCSTNRRPYLIKYIKPRLVEGMERFIPNHKYYHLEGAYKLEESYFEWSSDNYVAQSVDTSSLDGIPPCPQCGNQSAFAMCGCGKLLCIGDEDLVMCPWCEKSIKFSQGSSDFSITRGQG